jgi:hypothetical protein
MNRTFTPTLPPGVLTRLEAYADLFRSDFPLTRQADWSRVYLRGLLQDGERKSIEPLVARVDLPTTPFRWLGVGIIDRLLRSRPRAERRCQVRLPVPRGGSG